MTEEAARTLFKERNEENTSQEIAIESDLLNKLCEATFPWGWESAQAVTVWFPIFFISKKDRQGLKSSF